MEAGTLDRADANTSHGQCRRHFVTTLLQGGTAWKDIIEGVKTVEAGQGFCPDLKDL
jgi:hypothetical protein